MPREVEVALPLTVRLAGTPDRARLLEMERQVTATVLDRLAEAERELAARGYGDVPRTLPRPRVVTSGAVDNETRERVEAALVRAVNAAIAESGIARRQSLSRAGGAPRPLPRARPSGPAFEVIGRASATVTTGALIDIFRRYGTERSETVEILEALYADRLEEPVEVVAKRIAVRRPVFLDAIGETYAAEASRTVPTGKVPVWLYTTEPGAPPAFEEVASRSTGDLSPLRSELAAVTRLPDGTTVTYPGALVFFVHAYLPLVEASALFERLTAADLEAAVTTRDLAFIVHRESFERHLGVAWADYVREYGDTPATLGLRPFRTRQMTHYRALSYFMDAETVGATASDTLVFSRTRILTDGLLAALPQAARALLAPFADGASRTLGEDDHFGVWLGDWRGAHVYARFRLTEDQQLTARNRQRAAAVAKRVAALLRDADPYRIAWVAPLIGALGEFTQAGSPDQQATFDLFLDALADEGLFDAFFSNVETADFYTLHTLVVTFGLAGRYARHPRVLASQRLLNDRARKRRLNLYDADANRMYLEGDRERGLAAGGVVGDLDAIYTKDTEVFELPAGVQTRLGERAKKEAETLSEAILSGRETRSFTADEFFRECLMRAADALGITNDSFVKRTIEISARFVGVERREEEGIETFLVTWRLVRRYKGETTWTDIEGTTRTRISGYFEEVLTFWRIQRGFEFIQTLAVVLAVAVVVIVGIAFLPELIALGGGLKMIVASITIAELFYIAKLIFTDETPSIEGFALAALDGYLFAVGFRFAAFAAEGVALRLISGTATRSLATVRLASLLTRGAVGGASTGFLVTFAHDIYDIAVGRRSDFSSLKTYAINIGLGTVLGIAGELAVNAAMTRVMAAFAAAGRPGAQTAAEIGEIAQRLREEGVTFARFAAEARNIVGLLRERLSGVVDDVIADGIRNRFRAVLEEIASGYPAQLKHQRFLAGLDLAGLRLGESGLTGLERFILAAGTEIDDTAALAIVRALRQAGGERASAFFEMLGGLDRDLLVSLTRGGQLTPFLEASLASRLASARPELFSALLRQRFGLRVAGIDTFLRSLDELTTDAALQARILETLAAHPRLPTAAVTETVARIGALTDEAVLGLNAFFRVDLAERELLALIGGTGRDSLPRLLGLARGLGPTEMRAVIERGVAVEFARSPAAAAILERHGWAATEAVLDARFGGAFAGLDGFARRAQALALDEAGERSLFEALQENGRYSDESLLAVARTLDAVSPASRNALDALFGLEDHGILRATIEDILARQTAAGRAQTETLLRLPSRLQEHLPAFAHLDALEPLARHPGVFREIPGRADRDQLVTLLSRPPGGVPPDPERLIAALEDILTAHPGTPITNIPRSIGEARQLPTLDPRVPGHAELPADETAEIVRDIVAGRRLGVDAYAVGGAPATSTRALVEATARLVRDEIHPRVARQVFDTTAAGVSDIAAPGAVSRIYRVAARGNLRPDVSITFADADGHAVGLVGREAVTFSPTVRPGLTAEEELQRTVVNGLTLKANGVMTNLVRDEAQRTGVPILAQEIEAQLVAPTYEAVFTPALVDEAVAVMERRGVQGLAYVDRIRFYGPDGRIRFVWNNPRPRIER